MRVGPFELDDEKVAKARERFVANAQNRSKDRTTFEEYLELFANDCNTFVQIARGRGGNGENLHCLTIRDRYHRYFEELFPSRRGCHKRRKLCAIKKRKLCETKKKEMNARGRAGISRSELMNELISCAEQNNLNWSVVDTGRPSNKTILINEKKCRILFVSRAWRTPSHSGRLLTHLQISSQILNQTDFIIVYQKISDIKRFFVMSAHILQVYSGAIKSFYLPIEKLPAYRSHPPKVDWWQYENAWHLLKNRDALDNLAVGASLPLEVIVQPTLA